MTVILPEGLYTGVVYDAMYTDMGMRNFTLHNSIKPLPGRCRRLIPMFGPAFTCQGSRIKLASEINEDIRIEMFDRFKPGVIQVITGWDNYSVAHLGDISAALAEKFGAAGVVVDGSVRDAALIKRNITDMFIYCRSINPVDAYGKWQITTVQVPIHIAGQEGHVKINPGDYIFGDTDGVLVIPKDHAAEVLKRALKRRIKEDEMREAIKTKSPKEIYKKIGRWQ